MQRDSGLVRLSMKGTVLHPLFAIPSPGRRSPSPLGEGPDARAFRREKIRKQSEYTKEGN